MKKYLAILLILSGGNLLAWEYDFYTVSNDEPYVINRITGGSFQIEPILDLGSGDWSGAVRASETSIYTFERMNNLLVEVDVVNKVKLSTIQIKDDITVHPRGFDISPNGDLYGIFYDGSNMMLKTLNPNTGETSFVTDVTGTPLIEALAFSPEGELYAVGFPYSGSTDSRYLYNLNISSGTATLIADMSITGISDIDCLTYAPDGYLYGTDSLSGYMADLYQINPSTGELAIVGNTGIEGLNGILAVPEPATLLLLCLGGLVLRRRG